MPTYSRDDVAARAGVGVDEISRLVELGVLIPAEEGRSSAADSLRAGRVQSLDGATMHLHAPIARRVPS